MPALGPEQLPAWGCVEPDDHRVRLLDEKNNKSYTMVPGEVYLTPGQPVLLKGETSKDDGDTETFTARKLVKDLGSCAASLSPSAISASSGDALSRC